MPKLPNVAVAYSAAVPWMAMFIRGVAEYADRHGRWNLTTSPPTLAGAEELSQTVYSMRGWPGDGIIAAVTTTAEAKIASRLGIPVVNISGTMRGAVLPQVISDNAAMGRIAAEHLIARGHRRLAFYGIKGPHYSAQRCEGFLLRAKQAGIPCDVFESPMPENPKTPWRRQIAPLVNWLRRLQPPVGLMAVQDYRARVVLDECQRLGLNVPHDVAIIGVDDDPTVCEFCRPTLSSVSRNAWRAGCEAAAMLDALMHGRKPPSREILIPPDGISARQSTDTVAIDDPYLADAVHFMRDHLAERFNIADMMRRMRISRRQLELRFQNTLGCTPLDYLGRLRVEKVKDMLARPERPKLHAISAACGFPSEERMRLVFQRLTGVTPREYRNNPKHSP